MGAWAAAIQGVLGVDSSITEGKQAKKQADANAELARSAAVDALVRGRGEAADMRADGSDAAARQMVAFANAGVDQSTGTAANVQASTKAQAELEALTIENNAAREAFGYTKHGLQFETQAGIDAARRNRQAAGTLLGAAGNMFGRKKE